MSLGATDTAFNYDQLMAGDFPVKTESATIDTGVLARGTVLGKITATSKLVIVDSASMDGSQVPYAVLLQDVDATSADVVAPVALTGDFNVNKLVFGGSDTIATHRTALRALSIFASAAQAA